MSVEHWRPVVGHEGRYEVSSRGVRSLLTGKILKPSAIRAGGYHVVTLYNGGRSTRRVRRVHQMVLTAFVGPAPATLVCCHNDGDPTNNALSNLRWDTPSENMHDVVRHGRNRNANKTRCPKGHEYSAANVRVKHVRTTSQMQDVHSGIPAELPRPPGGLTRRQFLALAATLGLAKSSQCPTPLNFDVQSQPKLNAAPVTRGTYAGWPRPGCPS